jgi:hypothetical protein
MKSASTKIPRKPMPSANATVAPSGRASDCTVREKVLEPNPTGPLSAEADRNVTSVVKRANAIPAPPAASRTDRRRSFKALREMPYS